MDVRWELCLSVLVLLFSQGRVIWTQVSFGEFNSRPDLSTEGEQKLPQDAQLEFSHCRPHVRER